MMPIKISVHKSHSFRVCRVPMVRSFVFPSQITKNSMGFKNTKVIVFDRWDLCERVYTTIFRGTGLAVGDLYLDHLVGDIVQEEEGENSTGRLRHVVDIEL